MSLLIKALDHLEKNKQADKDKKQTGAYVADEALSLELVPIDSKVQEAELAEQVPVVDASEVIVKTVNVPLDQNLSLEEEAGLTDADFSANQYAKPKSAAKASNKSAVEAKPLQSSTQETLQSARVKSKATVASSTPALQMVNDELNQKAAAKVFVANKEVKAPSSKFALISLGVVGALLVLLGLQGYDYIKDLAKPDVVVLKPSAPQPQAAVVAPTTSAPMPTEVTTAAPEVAVQESQAVNQTNDAANADNKAGTAAFRNKALEKHDAVEDVIEAEPKKPSTKNANKNNEAVYDAADTSYAELIGNKKQKPLTLISKMQSQGVDPTLLAAYQAFTRGEDASAQQQYRQVLQRDVRNVDALLGMAAIAQRQGRDADAQGWYQKVLEIEPRNSIAQTAIVSPQANTDAVGAESRIKSMIAQQPEGANLHAALGNLYAEQSQWPSAQEAYFNASRLAPNNADYAFNLAISLDQMGKPSLALKQYQRALDLLNKSGGNSPDRAQLEARIRELQ
jgi:tetratricopeptide (TPR) repeat protein